MFLFEQLFCMLKRMIDFVISLPESELTFDFLDCHGVHPLRTDNISSRGQTMAGKSTQPSSANILTQMFDKSLRQREASYFLKPRPLAIRIDLKKEILAAGGQDQIDGPELQSQRLGQAQA